MTFLQLRHPDMLADCCLLLIIVFQNQEHSITEMPVKATLRLGDTPAFPKTLGELAEKGNRVLSLLVPVLKQATNIIQNEGDSSSMKALVKKLLSEVKLNNDDADAVVR